MSVPKKKANSNSRRALMKQTVVGMKRILMQFRLQVEEELKPRGVTVAQIQLLLAIRNTPGSSGAELARSCYITPQSVQTVLAQLEAAGWIVRGKEQTNDRILTAHLTAAGRRQTKVVDGLSAGIQERMWQGISEREMAALNALLQRCLTNLGETA
ncbi:MAG: MarR family transcriptional regulator [Edaphobacter sp.]|uniref:MarR family winged helix-turn-helix transcriptional regulator n=1 Tax=Edaphobacter sp. TaxID=1934404 RepID=UPI002392D140|nr:MarR family transcriptional regulator [Edaphobacter sp.]MDE1175287.1 MarR family transcriptional regulator [Edaphobacter sp.]